MKTVYMTKKILFGTGFCVITVWKELEVRSISKWKFPAEYHGNTSISVRAEINFRVLQVVWGTILIYVEGEKWPCTIHSRILQLRWFSGAELKKNRNTFKNFEDVDWFFMFKKILADFSSFLLKCKLFLYVIR